MREKKFIYRILIGKSSGKRPLSRRRQGWIDRRCRDVRGEIVRATTRYLDKYSGGLYVV
jgi:hypothetical protein